MPELPALLLSIYFRFLLVTVVTMPPSSRSQTPVLSSVRMGKSHTFRLVICGRQAQYLIVIVIVKISKPVVLKWFCFKNQI